LQREQARLHVIGRADVQAGHRRGDAARVERLPQNRPDVRPAELAVGVRGVARGEEEPAAGVDDAGADRLVERVEDRRREGHVGDLWAAGEDRPQADRQDAVAGGAVRIPETVTELTDHVLRVTPLFRGSALCDILHPGGYTITCREGDDLYLKGDAYLTGHQADAWPRVIPADALIRLDPHIVRYAFPTFTVMVDHGGSLYFERGRPRRVKLTLINNNLMYQQMWCTIKTYGPPGVLFPAGAEFSLHLNTLAGDRGECVITVDPAVFEGARLELLFDISFAGRHTAETVRAVLLRRPDGDFSFE